MLAQLVVSAQVSIVAHAIRVVDHLCVYSFRFRLKEKWVPVASSSCILLREFLGKPKSLAYGTSTYLRFSNVLGGNFSLVGVPSVGASGAIFGTVAVSLWYTLATNCSLVTGYMGRSLRALEDSLQTRDSGTNPPSLVRNSRTDVGIAFVDAR